MLSSTVVDFFASDPLDPTFNIHEILDKEHPISEVLKSDLDLISDSEVQKVMKSKHFEFYNSRTLEEKKELEARKWIALKELYKEITNKRNFALKNQVNETRPAPYNHPALEDIEIDKNFLVPLAEFQTDRPSSGFTRNGFSFTITPSLPSRNSSYWLNSFILQENIKESAWVRLDPFIFKPQSEFSAMMYKMRIWGVPLDWETLLKLKHADHGQWIPDWQSLNTIMRTDYIWRPDSSNGLHFTCEELPKENQRESRGSRYFHGIFNKGLGIISHCDGAIRFFSNDEYIKRQQVHVKDPSVIKIGTRVKIFQIKGDIAAEDFSGLVSSFFVWNQDVMDYFQSGI